MTTTVIGERWDIITPVVNDIVSRWRDYVERDDLKQEAMAWWYGKAQGYLPEYLAEENHVRLRRSLWRWLARYALKEKAARVGYLPLDQYRYTPTEVAVLLPAALDPDGVPDHGGPSDGPKPAGNLAEGGDILAALIDVRRAAEALAEDDIHFLTLVVDLRHDWERAGELMQIQTKSVQRRHQRVIERMCRWLNNEENYA